MGEGWELALLSSASEWSAPSGTLEVAAGGRWTGDFF